MSFSKRLGWLAFATLTILLFQNCEEYHVQSAFSQSDESRSRGSDYRFQCTDDKIASETQSLILSKKQIENAIEDLFGREVLDNIAGPLSALPAPINNSHNYARESLISSSDIDSLLAVGLAVATEVVQNKSRREAVFGSCSSNASPTASCINNFIDNFAVKIFRRPLKATESDFIRDLANSGEDYLVNLEGVLLYALQSPAFLWRVELGEGNSHSGDVTYLNQYEIASRIALSATDSIPDDELLSAARNGELKSMTQIRAQTKRLLKSKRGQAKVVEMLAWWSLADKSSDVSGLPPELLKGVDTDGLGEAASDEIRKFIKHIVFEKNGSFRDLMTSQKSFASHRGLASIYGHAPVGDESPALFEGRRQGLLMRFGFLSHDTFRTSIIHRGVDFQQRFLCNDIPSPNVEIMGDRDLEALSHEELLNYTNRDAVAHQTKSPVCMGCHSLINPTGFAFESFDSLGRLRQSEMIFDSENEFRFVQHLPVHPSSVVEMSSGKKEPLRDAYALINLMVDNGDGAACFSRNLFRYYNEKLETESDECEVQQVFTRAIKPTEPVLSAIVDLIANEHIGEKVH